MKPLSPTPLTFRKTARDPFKFLVPLQRDRLIGWARSFSDPLTVTDITMMGGRSFERLTRIAGRDVRLDDGHTVGKAFVRKVQGSMRRGRIQRFGCDCDRLTFKWKESIKKSPTESDEGSRPRLGPPGFLRSQVVERSTLNQATLCERVTSRFYNYIKINC